MEEKNQNPKEGGLTPQQIASLSSSHKKKEYLVMGLGLLVFALSVFLIVYCLTFLIKNINLILKPPVSLNNQVHFNLSEAAKLFPTVQGNTSTAP